MKIRMAVDISGTRNGQEWPHRGETFEVDDREGADLCAAGMATPVVEDRAEKAVPNEAETRKATKATKATGRKS